MKKTMKFKVNDTTGKDGMIYGDASVYSDAVIKGDAEVYDKSTFTPSGKMPSEKDA